MPEKSSETCKVYSFMRPFPHSRYLRHRKPHRTHIGEKNLLQKKKKKEKGKKNTASHFIGANKAAYFIAKKQAKR